MELPSKLLARTENETSNDRELISVKITLKNLKFKKKMQINIA